LLFSGYTDANPAMRTITDRSDLEWEDPKYLEETDDDDIFMPEHLKNKYSETQKTIKLSEISISDYLMTVKDSLGDPLFVKVYEPSAGSIEVIFLSRRD
jgi:hypothetical protein